MEQLPLPLYGLFIATTMLAVYLGYRAFNRSKTFLIASGIILGLEGIVASSGFFARTDPMPPRIVFMLVPLFAFVGWLLLSHRGNRITRNTHAEGLLWIHVVRVPVEIVLLLLALHHTVPMSMTFEGFNPDILSGASAPLIWYAVYRRKTLSRGWLLGWNLIGLGLLLNIVVRAMLAAPTPLQQWDFDQPNRAVLHAPFIWLPGYIVPLVLYSHLAAIRRLLQKKASVPPLLIG